VTAGHVDHTQFAAADRSESDRLMRLIEWRLAQCELRMAATEFRSAHKQLVIAQRRIARARAAFTAAQAEVARLTEREIP
jgi:hypothetical protein